MPRLELIGSATPVRMTSSGSRRVSRRARAPDTDYQAFVNHGWPERSFEGLLTVVCQYQIRDGWTVQPNFQYVTHPRGGALMPLKKLGLEPG